jgi:hypothetical protein
MGQRCVGWREFDLWFSTNPIFLGEGRGGLWWVGTPIHAAATSWTAASVVTDLRGQWLTEGAEAFTLSSAPWLLRGRTSSRGWRDVSRCAYFSRPFLTPSRARPPSLPLFPILLIPSHILDALHISTPHFHPTLSLLVTPYTAPPPASPPRAAHVLALGAL